MTDTAYTVQLAPGEHLFTSESVTEGHPDKLADRVSDSILDAIFAQDPNARVACETLVTTGLLVVAGEVSTSADVDYEQVAREAIASVGYTREELGFDASACEVRIELDEQSPDIASGVDHADEQRSEGSTDSLDELGAGDQGLMFGYACSETPQRMPLPITLAHALTRRLAALRRDRELEWLRPDGKAQVTVRYRDGEPVAVETVLVSTQHDPTVTRQLVGDALVEHLVRPVLGEWWRDDLRVLVNPTGTFVLGGPHADAGLTGRKVIVDTYGGAARHGGGAFSGKDCTKVDRSAAYAARWVARNVVAAGLAERCELQVAYAIGVAHPVSIAIESFGTARVAEHVLEQAVREVFDLRPAAIIRDLELRAPIYAQLSAYGHVGRDDFAVAWEREDRVEQLRDAVARITEGIAELEHA